MNTEYKNHRFLAAVMFVDMVGYTALMQEDESRAIRLRTLKRRIMESSVAGHQGKVVQYYGDGALIIFSSSYRAVKSAIQMQSRLQKHEIPVRIGIHLGEIVKDKEGVYGSAVNVASRIESLSLPGGILISGKVLAEIKNHREITCSPVGEFDLKNIEKPVSIYAIAHQKSLTVPDTIRQRWTEMVSAGTRKELISPYISNMHSGLLN